MESEPPVLWNLLDFLYQMGKLPIPAVLDKFLTIFFALATELEVH